MAQRARELRREVRAMVLAFRHPDTPRAARLVLGLVLAYALSPIDLVPDFIPVLGALDDLILVPLGLRFALRLIPPAVMAECRLKADEPGPTSNLGRLGAVLVVLLWAGGLAALYLALRARWPEA